MTYESVDALQKVLVDEVFHYATDRKKAAGRALDTLVEIATYYTLRAWEMRDHLAIERSVSEYGNSEISHNVEFSLHPIRHSHDVSISEERLPMTAAKISRAFKPLRDDNTWSKGNQLLSSNGIQRNLCVIGEGSFGIVTANVSDISGDSHHIVVNELFANPFAIFECRV